MALLTGPMLALKPPEFDPDAYLREKTAAPFDPDTYLREKRISEMASKTGALESFGRGAAQGATLGFGDELAGGYSAAQKQLERLPELKGVPDAELYASAMASPDEAMEARDQAREANEAARRAHGKAYLAGEVTGGMAPTAAATMATGGAAALPMSVAQGAAQGLGYSDASTARGLARDSLLGAGVSALGHGVGEAVGSAGRSLASLARTKASSAAGRAATQAAEEEAAKVASLASKHGAEVQKGSRYVENVMRLLEHGTPEQQALYDQLVKSGAVPGLQRQVLQSTLERLPDQAATIAAKKAELEAAQHALPQAVAARTAELSRPQIGADVASLAKSYGEPVLAAALAPPGMKEAAGLIFGRTRAGKAIATRINRPGNQIAIWNAAKAAGEAPATQAGTFLRRVLSAGATGAYAEPALAP